MNDPGLEQAKPERNGRDARVRSILSEPRSISKERLVHVSIPTHKIFVDSLNQVDFDRSFPARYRAAFRSEERARHAEICAAREWGGVSVGLQRSLKPGQSAVCINADDCPGMLASISAAFATLGLEIQEAVAFSRSMPDESREILDVFWIRDPSGIVGDDEVSSFANLLTEYLAGRTLEWNGNFDTRSEVPSGALVRFRDERAGTLSVLDVETGDRFGLLFEVSHALTTAGVQIVASEISTEGARVTDSFTIEETSGKAISAARRLEIQTLVLSTLEM